MEGLLSSVSQLTVTSAKKRTRVNICMVYLYPTVGIWR